MDAEVVELNDGTFLVAWTHRGDCIGPFRQSELKALLEALLEFFEEDEDEG